MYRKDVNPMLKAITNDGKLITAQDVQYGKSKEKSFYCPECKDVVILKNGIFKKSHFAHKPHSQCFESYEKESEIHLKGKLLLYDLLKKYYRNVEIEKYFVNIHQRADLSFEHNGGVYAIEFQCSIIPTKIVHKRTNGYIKSGIKPLWILSHQQLHTIGNHLFSFTAFHYSFLQQTSANKFIIPILNVDTENLYLLSHLLPISTKKSFAHLDLKPLRSHNLYELLNLRNNRMRMSFSSWLQERENIKRYGSFKYSSFSKRFKDEIYRCGFHMGNLPDFCGLPVRGSAKLSTSPIQWQTYIFIDILRHEELFSLEDAYDSMQCRLERKDIRIRVEVPIDLKEVIDAYLYLLNIIKVIEKIDGSTFQIRSSDMKNKKISKEEGEMIMKMALR
ncbi:competence protein CoiA [Cytobacillus kochii]|uniref:competence protein CoiA n=1 Tax=Cytobacillus kochii TaxID=859143 RepID=UPI0025A0CA81|nr:competence protein CoiA family protein [Cytobacillus kochii]MDM5206992.1 competence protein CoiA family protein [Cytobacillus kochii]